MALIQCKHCGEEVSDKATVCPHCGGVLMEEPVPEKKILLCEECGTEIPDGAISCPKCGCPVPSEAKETNDAPQKVEVTSINVPKMSAKKKKTIIGIIVAVILVAVIACVGISVNKKNQAAQYINNVELAASTMLTGAAKAETAGNLIKSVWYNSIYEKKDSSTDKYTRKYSGSGSFYDDFNDALSNLFKDSVFKSSISTIESNQNTVASLMKSLNNPPEEYEDAYDALKDLYEAYIDMTNLATNPTGSLQTFSSNFNSADSSFMTYYKKVKLYFE